MKKNDYLLSVTELKNILKKQSREEIIELLLDSYKASIQIKEYITAKYGENDKINQILETYKNKIHDVFFPKSMRGQFKIGEAKKVVNCFKKLCSDEKLVIDIMLYYVEMGVEFTNKYGDINESFYNNVESMYESIVNSINEHNNSEIFGILRKRLKAIVDDTSGIGWGFHDNLSSLYFEIIWIDVKDIDYDENELKQIKEYITERLKQRNNLLDSDKKMDIINTISEIINVDKVFLSKMDAQFRDYSNDDENDFISNKTSYSMELIELILWQKYCYEMDNDYWEYGEGKCSKCGSSELYIKEVLNGNFEDQVICKMCGTEFIRE
ncbi:hypothetical protein E4V42_07195 [Clostridium estertheticum]|uniref:Uncharacterized protein n=1 Tax=Clostridium estertheticum TaxID=238834 RepID=A0A5N7ILN8_9CLOT|nr:DUF6155 family protein [Clostridium estertheticum]MPQ31223.1 hypothetical protein [Clostridium estertheticum]MPQ61898.1 hypothetical protein [Clostridium estertheticum]